VDHDFDFSSDYIDYDTARDAEGGPHNGRREMSTGTTRFVVWALVVMMLVFSGIGVIAHWAR